LIRNCLLKQVIEAKIEEGIERRRRRGRRRGRRRMQLLDLMKVLLREDTGILKRNHSIMFCGELDLEETVVLSLEDPGADGMIIVKWMLQRWDGAWSRSLWLKTGTGGGLL
jgi:hypothetical protein